MKRKLMVIDPSLAGISGDMFLAALADLNGGTPILNIAEAVKRVTGVDAKVKLKKVKRGGLNATLIDTRGLEVHVKDPISTAEKVCRVAGLSDDSVSFALRVIETVLEAEAFIHGKEKGKVHLHELSNLDLVFEVACVTAILERLGYFTGLLEVYSTPVAVGGGYVETEHGILPVPAPATLRILEKARFPFKGGPVNVELATPTGVALLVNVAKPVAFYPCVKPLKTGFGAGQREIPGLPNVLRVLLGEPWGWGVQEELYVVETNLDDVTGETLGYLVERLLEEGVKDVVLHHVTMKKSRPGVVVSVICDGWLLHRVCRVIIEETGTLGVRFYPVKRLILDRKAEEVEVEVKGEKTSLKVKVAKDLQGRTLKIKPEYEDLARIAKKHGIPLREVNSIVLRELREKITSKPVNKKSNGVKPEREH